MPLVSEKEELSASKSGSPVFRRGLTRVGKWVHVARRALSANRQYSPSHTEKQTLSAESSMEPDHSEPETESEFGSHSKRTSEENKDRITALQTELERARQLLKQKDELITNLRNEIDKLKDSLRVTNNSSSSMPDHITTEFSPDEENYRGRRIPLIKKQGVSGESGCFQDFTDIQITRHEKDLKSKELIKNAILGNEFLCNLDNSQVQEIVDCMYPQDVPSGTLVIREGDVGSHLYVSAEGELEVHKEGKFLGFLQPGKAFGELAILYNCTRTASVQAIEDSKVWVLDRKVFQIIMMKTGIQRQENNIKFLKSVPLLHNLSNEILAKMADVLEVDFYHSGEYIIRQGATGDTFFIISSGKVTVTQKNSEIEEEIRCLERGDYFGERALLTEDKRTANVIASEPGVECLALDRDSFKQLIGDLRELQDKEYDDEARRSKTELTSESEKTERREFDNIALEDLQVIATLGVGGFGRVELVQWTKDRSKTFALKSLRKDRIVATEQQHHILCEKKIMMACQHSFICRLYQTYKTKKHVFLLMEACLGGEIWTYLRDRTCFDDATTRFYVGCVIEALEYLHAKNIIYRDLKPENLMLDNQGYVKLVDFGFATILHNGKKTWTFCGTPEYVAPEVILNKGHDRAVDFWAIGILMYELFTGMPPFMASDPMQTYNIILKGIDVIDFPRRIPKAAQGLIKRLCRDNPVERLGYQKGGIADIKKHKWFRGFHWEGLIERTLTPPIVPKVQSSTDTRNFDIYPNDYDVPKDEDSGWDKDF